MNTELSLEWGKWLSSKEWDYFLTITSREPVPAHRGESVLNAIGRTLETHNPECVFLCGEKHLSLAMHFHGLYKSARGKLTYASAIWSHLFEVFGRSDVKPPRDKGAVAAYVSKYVVKGDMGLWGMYGGLTQPSGMSDEDLCDPFPRPIRTPLISEAVDAAMRGTDDRQLLLPGGGWTADH